jgi:hypothetical protein
MKRRIVFGCYGPPGWGDANAWAYRLFAQLRAEGPFDLTLVQLSNDADAFFFRFAYGADFDDPRRLGTVPCRIDESNAEQPALRDLLRALAPDGIVAWGIDAARLLLRAKCKAPLTLMLAECGSVDRMVEDDFVRDWMGLQSALQRGVNFPVGIERREREVFEGADLVVAVSLQAHPAFRPFSRFLSGKVYQRAITPADLLFAEAEEHASLRRPFLERDVDVLFCAASWAKRSANRELAERLAAALRGCEVHAVGEIDGPLGGARVHGPLRREDLFALLGRTKVAVFPALAEAGPSLLLEAAAMDCNVVASPNCGYAALCDDALLARRCSAEEMLERIGRALARPYDHNRDPFLGGTADLVETLAVL